MGRKRGSREDTFALVLVQMLVWYKPTVLDPERADLLDRLRGQGYDFVEAASRAKFFQLKLANTTLRKARIHARKVGTLLLANPVTEVFEIIKVEPI